MLGLYLYQGRLDFRAFWRRSRETRVKATALWRRYWRVQFTLEDVGESGAACVRRQCAA